MIMPRQSENIVPALNRGILPRDKAPIVCAMID